MLTNLKLSYLSHRNYFKYTELKEHTLFVFFEKTMRQGAAVIFIRATKTNDQSSPSAVVSKSTNNLFNYLIKLP